MATYLITTRNCKKWAANKKGDTPLSIAGRQGHEEFISLIYHEERNEPQVQEWLRTAQLHNAARDGYDQKVKELLNDGSLHLDEMDRQGRSPWLWAVEKGRGRVLEVLLNRPDIKFLRSGLGISKYDETEGPGPLHVTALAGHDSAMRVLLQSGKFDGELDRTCRYVTRAPKGKMMIGRTPLGIANQCEHKDTSSSFPFTAPKHRQHALAPIKPARYSTPRRIANRLPSRVHPPPVCLHSGINSPLPQYTHAPPRTALHSLRNHLRARNLARDLTPLMGFLTEDSERDFSAGNARAVDDDVAEVAAGAVEDGHDVAHVVKASGLEAWYGVLVVFSIVEE
ncbi:uncharacterized protein BDZ99DRAFT_516057 [Mytilinidion resinicola]|uniref:Ankyrin n=1 Tax=Mytilinidion resinicola TaxID=574789 RepID=A0A6A6Z3U8_9PEZI|nr:uncharacterized protein BDZ99DRAFT_516057 [Mytilinidion resinicola]KAF2815323.1 hypothetical protein BDZ99DRAFT_516057 [Mytilinidion resinicola]